MIRINLIGERKKQLITLKAPTGPPKSSFLLLLFLLVFVIAGAYLYKRYQYLTKEDSQLQTELAEKEREKQQRQQMLNDIDRFEKRKKILENRIAVINELKRNQLGPIQWLNALSVAVDESQSVWLTSVDQTGGNMRLEGVSTTLKGVANFTTSLKRSATFQNVVINESIRTNVSGLEGFLFTITLETKSGTGPTKS